MSRTTGGTEHQLPTAAKRWLPLAKWLLAFPHYILVGGLVGSGYVVATTMQDNRVVSYSTPSLIGACVLIAAIAMLFTTGYPPGLFDLRLESVVPIHLLRLPQRPVRLPPRDLRLRGRRRRRHGCRRRRHGGCGWGHDAAGSGRGLVRGGGDPKPACHAYESSDDRPQADQYEADYGQDAAAALLVPGADDAPDAQRYGHEPEDQGVRGCFTAFRYS
jgi:hypothetical protein